MSLTCNNCNEILNKYLCDIPAFWKEEIVNSICDSIASDIDINCSDIEKCETLTSLSAFSKRGNLISIIFKDERGLDINRSFDVSQLMNNALSGLNPKCIATFSDWASYSFNEKIQAILDYDCNCCTSTTTTTTTVPTTTSTTTTTTKICKSYYFQNNCEGRTNGSLSYIRCDGVVIDASPKCGSNGYFCALQGTVSASQTISIIEIGNCPDGITTTSTTSTTSSTTTTSSSTTTTTTAHQCRAYHWLNDCSGEVFGSLNYINCQGSVIDSRPKCGSSGIICAIEGTVSGSEHMVITTLSLCDDLTTTTTSSSTTTTTTFCRGVIGIGIDAIDDNTTTSTTTTSSTTTTTTMAEIISYWGFKATNSTLSVPEIEASSYHDTFPIGGTVIADYTDNPNPKFLWMAEHSTEPIKTKWYGSAGNNGNIGNPTDLFGAPVIVGAYRFYITQYLTQNTDTNIEFRVL